MFDLTKNIILEKDDRQKYRRLQIALYIISLAGLVYFTLFFLMFPNQNYFFSFDNNSDRNIDLELKGDDFSPIDNGNLDAKKRVFFNVPLDGDFSQMRINFDVDQNLSSQELAQLKIRRSFQAFFYPEGQPIGFKDGWLLRNGDDYYIVSQGQLRRFKDVNLLKKMGYDESAFTSVGPQELTYNQLGDNIADDGSYPESSIFDINGNFYILKEGQLHQFISHNAYLSNYPDRQAVKKNEDILARYPVAADQIGFADGSLIANPDAVFVVDGGLLYAIGSVDVFSIKGFSWKDVIQATSEEMSFYPNVNRSKIFSAMSPHSNGTIFHDAKSDKFFLVRDLHKLPVASENIAKSWSVRQPVAVSEESLKTYDSCSLVRSFWNSHRYSCQIDIENLSAYPGTDYQIGLVPKNDVRLNYIDMVFKKNFSKYNLKRTFDSIINQLTKNYGNQ